MKFDAPATTNPIDQLKIVGQPTDRIDGPLKTTGRAPYAYERYDAAPNAAYGYVVGAAISKGRILSIDSLFESAQRILAEVDEAEAESIHGRVEPQGVLRVSAPTALGHAHVSPVCRDLVGAYPKISADLTLTDRLVDLIDERMDVVVRIGTPKDSDLVMRKLADNYRIVVAAPDYLERRGTPVVPEDLMGHECLLYRVPETHWSLVGPGGKAAELGVACRLRCNSGEVAHDWALAGCGLNEIG